MTITTRAFLRFTRLQWPRLASTSPKAPRRPYKPTSIRPKQPSLPPQEPETLLSVWRRSWLPLSGAALLAGSLGFYIVGTATASIAPSHALSCEHAVPTGRPRALNAHQFDRELDIPEWWTGITDLRKKLAARATGNVLELAMGTGRNLPFYKWERMASFTGLDISGDMLDVARERLPAVLEDHRARLIRTDVHHALPAARGPGRASDVYDTVVQTFGLCSVADPVAVLCNLASVVKPDTGRIILLEHGRGWYGLVNGLLDRNAAKHFDKYGCWWNRDIEALVDEAVRQTPGLEIVKLQRPKIMQMGTLVWVELRMRPGMSVSQPQGI